MKKQATAKILKEVLAEVFTETMRQYHPQAQAQAIFDYIFAQQLLNWTKCFGSDGKQLQPKFD